MAGLTTIFLTLRNRLTGCQTDTDHVYEKDKPAPPRPTDPFKRPINEPQFAYSCRVLVPHCLRHGGRYVPTKHAQALAWRLSNLWRNLVGNAAAHVQRQEGSVHGDGASGERPVPADRAGYSQGKCLQRGKGLPGAAPRGFIVRAHEKRGLQLLFRNRPQDGKRHAWRHLLATSHFAFSIGVRPATRSFCQMSNHDHLLVETVSRICRRQCVNLRASIPDISTAGTSWWVMCLKVAIKLSWYGKKTTFWLTGRMRIKRSVQKQKLSSAFDDQIHRLTIKQHS